MTGTIIGVIGMLIVLVGVYLTGREKLQKHCFLWGSVLLLVPALMVYDKVFISLETILILGAVVAFTPFKKYIKAVIPIILGIAALGWMYATNAFADWSSFAGAAGFLTLAVGYAISHPLIYLLGSLCLIVYSTAGWLAGSNIALIWLILNIVFAIGAIKQLIKMNA